MSGGTFGANTLGLDHYAKFGHHGVLARAAQELEYLETAVAVVLGFVGLKLGAGYFGYEVSTEASLAVIFLVLGAGVAASVLLPEEES